MMNNQFNNPANRKKLPVHEQKRVRNRIAELLKETKNYNLIADILNNEGFRRPNGQLINYQSVYLKARSILKPNGRNAPPVKVVYDKAVNDSIDIKGIKYLVKYIKDDAALGAAVREAIK